MNKYSLSLRAGNNPNNTHYWKSARQDSLPFFSFTCSPLDTNSEIESSTDSPDILTTPKHVSHPKRYNFSQKTKSVIRETSYDRCAHCGLGLGHIPGSSRKTGELAHIYDANPNFGLRPHPSRIFDPETQRWDYPKETADYIKSEENGILVCGMCHKLIDHSNPAPNVETLMHEKHNLHPKAYILTLLDIGLFCATFGVLGYGFGRMQRNRTNRKAYA